MQILVRWLHQKLTDLDLQCFQKRIIPGSAGQGSILFIIKTILNDATVV